MSLIEATRNLLHRITLDDEENEEGTELQVSIYFLYKVLKTHDVNPDEIFNLPEKLRMIITIKHVESTYQKEEIMDILKEILLDKSKDELTKILKDNGFSDFSIHIHNNLEFLIKEYLS